MMIQGSTQNLRQLLQRVRNWALANSPWLVHYNSGSCNGCDIEILATLTPRYDLERLGIKLQGSPRHADVLVCTGPVTRQSRERLIRIYEQMPEPKFVVAVGTCSISGGAFRGCYNILGGVDAVIPVDAYIPGCPPRPEAVIHGVAALLKQLQPQRAAEIDHLLADMGATPEEELIDERAELSGTR
ncbi:putative Ni,Fe-hydrogenase III small subunit [Candidatus Promineifilum breve]|uniref:Ni,Fe-hydrogenase III small subunit n=1 Tax=Candidatus Promineifilum breve TaxID=1806508 RepID=A0A160SYT6_9CHLR|nr:NADH-quinone oxidoreductase subunit B family protein [Candidatus Promineifilum breve]CUS02142.2 putative Ni,Fe-hydrogenase III small subunit [Candidatus Promineifilum breve]